MPSILSGRRSHAGTLDETKRREKTPDRASAPAVVSLAACGRVAATSDARCEFEVSIKSELELKNSIRSHLPPMPVKKGRLTQLSGRLKLPRAPAKPGVPLLDVHSMRDLPHMLGLGEPKALSFRVETTREMAGWIESIDAHAKYGLTELRAVVEGRASAPREGSSEGAANLPEGHQNKENRAMQRVLAAGPTSSLAPSPREEPAAAKKATPTSAVADLGEVSYWLDDTRSRVNSVEYAKLKAQQSDQEPAWLTSAEAVLGKKPAREPMKVDGGRKRRLTSIINSTAAKAAAAEAGEEEQEPSWLSEAADVVATVGQRARRSIFGGATTAPLVARPEPDGRRSGGGRALLALATIALLLGAGAGDPAVRSAFRSAPVAPPPARRVMGPNEALLLGCAVPVGAALISSANAAKAAAPVVKAAAPVVKAAAPRVVKGAAVAAGGGATILARVAVLMFHLAKRSPIGAAAVVMAPPPPFEVLGAHSLNSAPLDRGPFQLLIAPMPLRSSLGQLMRDLPRGLAANVKRVGRIARPLAPLLKKAPGVLQLASEVAALWPLMIWALA